MKLKFLNLIGVLLFLNFAKSNNEYFERSIMKNLILLKGQFEVDFELDYIEFFTQHFNKTLSVKGREKQNFKICEGEYFEDNQKMINNKIYNSINKFNYFKNKNNLENYIVSFDNNQCIRAEIDVVLSKWELKYFYNHTNFNHINLGPSLFLNLLLDQYYQNIKNVICKDNDDGILKKCSIEKEIIKLEYYLNSKDNYTMFPVKIELFNKRPILGWKISKRIKFSNFKPIFDQLESIVDSRLTIGAGCKRKSYENKFYPQIETNYGNRFKLDYNIKFNYVFYNRVNITNSKLFKFVKLHLTRNYRNQMFVDLNRSINIENTIDEFTNKSIITIYNTTTYLLDKIELEDNKCFNFDLRTNYTLNYFYIQQLFVNRTEIFFNRKDYTYLGNYNLNKIDCLVFEKVTNDELVWQNKILDYSNFKNKNRLKKPNYLIITHYYAKKENYWSANGLIIPIKIGIKLMQNMLGYPNSIANLSIEINSFNLNPKDFKEYDTSKCERINENY